jgi:hypothetical protein
MNIETVSTTVRHLMPGDVLAGSGFVVKGRPFKQIGTQRGKVVVVGRYPFQDSDHWNIWNPSTTVRVTRKV